MVFLKLFGPDVTGCVAKRKPLCLDFSVTLMEGIHQFWSELPMVNASFFFIIKLKQPMMGDLV